MRAHVCLNMDELRTKPAVDVSAAVTASQQLLREQKVYVSIAGLIGAGKSTLLRIMAKIYAPATGSVIWAPGVTVSLLSLGLGFKMS